MERVDCEICGWSGYEDDLVMDWQEEHNSSMPIASICPDCGNYIER